MLIRMGEGPVTSLREEAAADAGGGGGGGSVYMTLTGSTSLGRPAPPQVDWWSWS